MSSYSRGCWFEPGKTRFDKPWKYVHMCQILMAPVSGWGLSNFVAVIHSFIFGLRFVAYPIPPCITDGRWKISNNDPFTPRMSWDVKIIDSLHSEIVYCCSYVIKIRIWKVLMCWPSRMSRIFEKTGPILRKLELWTWKYPPFHERIRIFGFQSCPPSRIRNGRFWIRNFILTSRSEFASQACDTNGRCG